MSNDTIKIAKAQITRHKKIMMVDMFDEGFNRVYFHLSHDGKYLFSVFAKKIHRYGKTDKKIETIEDVMNFLNEEGLASISITQKEN